MMIFADESKNSRYIFGAVAVREQDVVLIRQSIVRLLMPGQRSLHFTKESARRRKELLKRLEALEIQLFVITTRLKDSRQGRAEALVGLVELAKRVGCSELVIEQDSSSYQADKRLLSCLLIGSTTRFSIVERQREPLLWAADAIAWSFQRGGDFKKMLKRSGLITIAR